MARGRFPGTNSAAPGPLQDDATFRLTVHEGAWVPVPMGDPPVGGVRIMASDTSETVSKGARSAQVWNTAGQYPIPCLKTFFTSETTGPSTQYDAQIATFLSNADSGTTFRGQVFEVGNEPYDSQTQDQALRAIAGCYARLRRAGRRVLMPHFISSASWGGAITKLNNPTAATGYCTWDMIDGFALHHYGDTPESAIDAMISLRNALDAQSQAKTIWLTECGWPNDRLGNMHAASQNPGTSWPDAGYTPSQVATRINALMTYLDPLTPLGSKHAGEDAKTLRCRNWNYFSYGDYNPGSQNGYSHCGSVEQDTRSTAGPPNYQDATGGGASWVLHGTPYDGRAKGAGTAGPPVNGSGPYGTILSALRALPKTLDCS